MNSDLRQDVRALVVGGGVVDRRLRRSITLLDAYREDEGTRYLSYVPITPPDRLLPEDLAVTVTSSTPASGIGPSRASRTSARRSISPASPPSRWRTRPRRSETRSQWSSPRSRRGRGSLRALPRRSSTRSAPALVPILDNQAIFGSYMTDTWPHKRSSQESVESESRIRDALERIAVDLTREENREVWPILHEREPRRSRIELFDMVWWSYFRSIEDPSGTLRARLGALAAFLPVFERADFELGTWAGGEEEDGVIQMPYYSFGPEAQRFLRVADDYGWVTSFDWGAWAQTPEARRLLDGGLAIDAATPDELGYVLTTIIRAERFGDGQIADACRSGLLLAIVRRAAGLASEEPLKSE